MNEVDSAILKLSGEDHSVPLDGETTKVVRTRKPHRCSGCGAEIPARDEALRIAADDTRCAGSFRRKVFRSDYYCSGCYRVSSERPNPPEKAAKKAEEQKIGVADATADQ